MKYHFISLAIIAALTIAFNVAYCSSQQAKAAEIKPVCIEAHLGLNKNESIVICGKVVVL